MRRKVPLQMKRVIDISESLGTVDTREGICELCATAQAGYEDNTGRLVIQLESFLRTTDLRTRERRIEAGWLPGPEEVTEKVEQAEAGDVAREIFHRWARKVREAAPALHQV